MGAIGEFIKSFGVSRIAAMGAVALGLVGFFVFMVMRYSAVSEVPLYTGLSMEDSASIVEELKSSNAKFTLRDNGTTIMVPETEVFDVRMKLAQEGLPSGGGVGYEIFDKTDALGTTSFVQSVNALRALEGELARTIRTLRQVDQVRVHLVLPEKQLFRKDEQKPTASIVLKTRGMLDPAQVRAIQHLVASAVPGLEPSRISLIDENGRLLAKGNGDDNEYVASNMDERTQAYQKQVEERIRDIVESVVGVGRARVRVAAELDPDSISETKDVFDPDGQVVRSTQTREEQSASQNGQANGAVSASTQLPNATAASGSGSDQSRDNAQTTEETVNYEISKTTQTRVTQAGGVKRLSVAVLIDGIYSKDASGKDVYTPRQQAELDQISTLVRTAMGFDQNRGDQLQVVNLQFASGPDLGAPVAAPGMLDFSKEDIVRFAEQGVLVLVTLLVLLFAVRPLIRRIVTPELAEGVVAAGAPGALLTDGTSKGAVTVVMGPDGKTVVKEMDAEGKPVAQEPGAPPPDTRRIEEAKAKGALQTEQVRKVGELVDSNPNEAAIIIRNWLTEAGI